MIEIVSASQTTGTSTTWVSSTPITSPKGMLGGSQAPGCSLNELANPSHTLSMAAALTLRLSRLSSIPDKAAGRSRRQASAENPFSNTTRVKHSKQRTDEMTGSTSSIRSTTSSGSAYSTAGAGDGESQRS